MAAREGAFELVSDFRPRGDQPAAIESLAAGLAAGEKRVCLLGVTGSGKTFTIANAVARTNRPTLVLARNKRLAALEKRGHRGVDKKSTSCSVQAIAILDDGTRVGFSDPRRGGTAVGE